MITTSDVWIAGTLFFERWIYFSLFDYQYLNNEKLNFISNLNSLQDKGVYVLVLNYDLYYIDLKGLKYPFFNHQAKPTYFNTNLYYFFEKNKIN
jgi:hypothetical protein